jgi:pimeloyl-ACP methyl ester carboxylesterase
MMLGLSDHKHPTVVSEFLSDIAEFVNALGWTQKFAIIGHSMGSITAQYFAGMAKGLCYENRDSPDCTAALPERVSRLVLIDALGPRPSKQPRHVQLGDGIRSRLVRFWLCFRRFMVSFRLLLFSCWQPRPTVCLRIRNLLRERS